MSHIRPVPGSPAVDASYGITCLLGVRPSITMIAMFAMMRKDLVATRASVHTSLLSVWRRRGNLGGVSSGNFPAKKEENRRRKPWPFGLKLIDNLLPTSGGDLHAVNKDVSFRRVCV